MELQSFISKALTDIFSGIQDAQEKLPSGAIVPAVTNSFECVQHGVSEIQAVSFEVVVRADETKGKEAKLNVVASIIGSSVAGQSCTGEGHTATLRFKVPVKLRCLEREKTLSPEG